MTWIAVSAVRPCDPWNRPSRCGSEEVILHRLTTDSVNSDPCPSWLQIPPGGLEPTSPQPRNRRRHSEPAQGCLTCPAPWRRAARTWATAAGGVACPDGWTGQSTQSASPPRPDATGKPPRPPGRATIPIQRSPGPNMAVPADVFPDERTPTAGGLVSTSSTSDSGAVGWGGFGAVRLVSTSSTSVSRCPRSSLVELVETNGTFVEAHPKMTHFHRRSNARDRRARRLTLRW